jgi:hypothetical protein
MNTERVRKLYGKRLLGMKAGNEFNSVSRWYTQPDLLSLVSNPQPVTKRSKPASVVVVASKELVVGLE